MYPYSPAVLAVDMLVASCGIQGAEGSKYCFVEVLMLPYPVMQLLVTANGTVCR